MHSDPCDSTIENRFKPFVEQRVGKRPHFHVFIHSFRYLLMHIMCQVLYKMLGDVVANKTDTGSCFWSSRGGKHL